MQMESEIMKQPFDLLH